jgi:hypothetical protein
VHGRRHGIPGAEGGDAGARATAAVGVLAASAFAPDQELRDLDRVERGALAKVVEQEEDESVRLGGLADSTDEDISTPGLPGRRESSSACSAPHREDRASSARRRLGLDLTVRVAIITGTRTQFALIGSGNP